MGSVSEVYMTDYDNSDKSDTINEDAGHEALAQTLGDIELDYITDLEENNIVTEVSEYETVYGESFSAEEPHKTVIRGVDNNDIQSEDTTERMEATDDILEDNYEPPTDNSESQSDYNSPSNPQYKSELQNSNFQSEFFSSENIQNVVFSIPAQFRSFLQEPPDWINKDYW